jgi:hypothetical protein
MLHNEEGVRYFPIDSLALVCLHLNDSLSVGDHAEAEDFDISWFVHDSPQAFNSMKF